MALTIDDPGYFERLARVEADHWWSRSMWRIAAGWLAPAVRDRTDLTAIDVGCGAGLTLARLARLPGVARVIGLEPNRTALGLARRRAPFPLVQGSARSLPFPPRSFDVVTCFDVLQHLNQDDDNLALAEIARTLRPGGWVVIRSNAAAGRPGRREGGTAFRLRDLVEQVAGAGLRVVRASHVNCLPAVIQEVRGRWGASIRRGTTGHRPMSHPAGGGLRIDVPAPAINAMMGRVARVEEWALVRLRCRLPFGHGTMILAHRDPEEGEP